MGKAGRPRTGNVRLRASVPVEVLKSLQEEAKMRELTVGQLIEDTFRARFIIVRKTPAT